MIARGLNTGLLATHGAAILVKIICGAVLASKVARQAASNDVLNKLLCFETFVGLVQTARLGSVVSFVSLVTTWTHRRTSRTGHVR
eukprot:SAG31_NODE_3572_length_4115_cov_2.951693_4_plen_86_part_00